MRRAISYLRQQARGLDDAADMVVERTAGTVSTATGELRGVAEEYREAASMLERLVEASEAAESKKRPKASAAAAGPVAGATTTPKPKRGRPPKKMATAATEPAPAPPEARTPPLFTDANGARSPEAEA